MKNRLYAFLAIALMAGSVESAKANDTFISFAQSTSVAGSVWKYLDNGTNQATAWRGVGFNDAAWASGGSELGYGDGDENTVVSFGGNSSNKYITTYFRKVINIPNPAAYTSFILNVKRDDGIVVYVNGVEVYRNNLGAGAVTSTTLASLGGDDGETVLTTGLPTSAFVAGNNTIAVEIHQNSITSTDITFDMELIGNDGAATVTRGPYLQMGGQTSITIRWQSDVPTNSRVEWGTSFGSYPNVVNDAAVTSSHSMNITGLTADTKYYYRIGSSTAIQLAASNNYFLTLPLANATRKLRFAALGDCGNNSTNQRDTKTALVNYIGANDLDALITLGDNAYNSGLDNEFQTGFFNVYQNDILRYMKFYPTPGNHDYGNSSSNTGVRNNAYYTNFLLPAAGELGGVASGTEAYYSYNIGDVHFISLDSYGREDANTTKVYDTLGAQAIWVKNDLAANTKRWTVVYYHHPPYTKTSHNSDTETDLRAMRENFIRILERYGVDLVLCGHAHGYERSYLLKGFYNNYASPLQSTDFNINLHAADPSTGEYDGSPQSCALNYNSGQYNHGSVYIVAGSSGQIGGSAAGYPHKAMVYSNNTNGGTLYFEVDSNRLDAKFVSYSGTGGSVTPVIRDQFTIYKDVNKVQDIVVSVNDPLTLTASWRGNYIWPANGNATTQAVQPSTAVPGNFNYVVRDGAGCIRDSFHVTVATVLPVTIDKFDATLQKDKVLLTWSSLQEINNRSFSIERSTDGTMYSLLGTVNAQGSVSKGHDYQMTDYQPMEGANYYRLSQTDIDSRVRNLETKRVNYKSYHDFSVTMLNTGNGRVKLLLNSKVAARYILTVTDMLGKEISKQIMNVPQGTINKTMQLQKGVYAIQISNATGRVIQKMLVE